MDIQELGREPPSGPAPALHSLFYWIAQNPFHVFCPPTGESLAFPLLSSSAGKAALVFSFASLHPSRWNHCSPGPLLRHWTALSSPRGHLCQFPGPNQKAFQRKVWLYWLVQTLYHVLGKFSTSSNHFFFFQFIPQALAITNSSYLFLACLLAFVHASHWLHISIYFSLLLVDL